MTRSLSLLLCLLFSACGSDPISSDLHYGTFTPGRDTLRSWSAFTTIENQGCRLPVQLYSFAGSTVSPEQAAFVKSSFEQAVRDWTSALVQNPQWRCKYASVFWGDRGPGTIQIYLDPSVERAYTVVGKNQIYLSLASTIPTDQFAARVILHEMGHIFGLADTYTEPGYQQPIGQPKGIMNQLFEVEGLTADDLAGAYAVYEFINGRGSFCDQGYKVGGSYENQSQIAFCVPAFGPQVPPEIPFR